MEDIKSVVLKNLEILPEYCIYTQIDGFVECLFSVNWIRSVVKDSKYSSPPLHHLLQAEEILSILQLHEDIGSYWQRYLVQVLPKKNEDIYPLPRRTNADRSNASQDMTFPQLLNYVSVGNMKNLWNDCYSKFADHTVVQQWKSGYKVMLEPHDTVTRDVLERIYRCPVINLSSSSSDSGDDCGKSSLKKNIHPNIHPALCVLESQDYFFVIMEPSTFSVFHCINYSPSKLQENETGALFFIYQLLDAVQDIHERGLFLGNISLHHLRLDSDFHLSIIPCITASLLHPPSDDEITEKKGRPHSSEHWVLNADAVNGKNRTVSFLALISNDRVKNLLLQSQSCVAMGSENLSEMCLLQLTQLWVTHEINNFEYLLSLSYIAGHSFESPLYYPVLPWVTDFTSPSDGWRDLTKSKYRLNKGDQQLDHTYELADTDGHQDQIPHHIPEVFSEVTYYVYKARVTPKTVLQKHVRQQFVASHYPATISRMYAFTPEECIPEFYCDPSIFKSIHEDLPDLEVPSWCSGIDDFIRYHRQALESNYVSRRLHYWIDLYYGFKLTGSASVKAKNVCLSLVDGHKTLSEGGVIQLFNIPHPPKLSPSPYLSKVPPLPYRSDAEDMKESDGSSGRATKEYPRSPKSLGTTSKSNIRDSGQQQKTNADSFIELPHNYNPLTALNQLEMLFSFTLKLSSTLPESVSVQQIDSSSVKQVALLSRANDMKVLACIIVQIFCPLRCRTLNPKMLLEDRYRFCAKVFQESSDIPKCLNYFLNITFGMGEEGNSLKPCTVTSRGLPPPSTYQLLQPVLDILSLPTYFKSLMLFIKGMKTYMRCLDEATEITDPNTRNERLQAVTENYMVKALRELKELLPPLSPDALKLVLPYVLELFRNPSSSSSAAWHLTDIVLQTLTPPEATNSVLPLLVKLFESDIISSNCFRLFQQTFLLQLMVRFGVKNFLNNFITPVIEGVGGYKTCVEGSEEYQLISRHSPNLKNVVASHIVAEQLSQNSPDEECGPQFGSNFMATLEAKASKIRSPGGVETDITDAEMDTELFVFEGRDDDDDETKVEDYGSAALTVNDSSRTPVASDSESCGEGSLQEEVIDRTSVSSVCASPVSPSLSGEEDQLSSEDIVDYPKAESSKKAPNLSIPVPSLKLPEMVDSSEYSRSLPENPLFFSIYQKQSEEIESSVNSNQKEEHVSREPVVDLSLAEMCSENVLWLAHKLGPVLTARHLTRNLLRMLTLCYVPESGALSILKPVPTELQDEMSITGKRIVGDKNSAKVLACLSEIAEVYGEQVILVQYLSHITELVGWCGSKFTSNQEAGLIGAMSLLQHLLLHLSDTTFMDHMQETLIRNAVYPVIRLLSSVKVFFPNGAAVRSTLAWRVVDSLYIMARRVGMEMSKEKLSPAITRFLSAFDKVHLERRQMTDSPKNIEYESSEAAGNNSALENQRDRNLEEMKQVFAPEMAYLSYVPFCRFLGTRHMEDILPCHSLLRSLCLQFDENNQADLAAELTFGNLSTVDAGHIADCSASSPTKFHRLFGTDVAAVTGNRIDIKDSGGELIDQSVEISYIESSSVPLKSSGLEATDTTRHLKGNWLAYWEHEIGRNNQDKSFNLKQIKLQSFIGHTSSVKGIYVLDNENSFISCSKDKTVKLWSLRSQGDGTAECKPQSTYTNHKKSVFGITFSDPLRLVASCDSTIHIWDPFTGICLKQLDSLKHSPVTVLCSMAAPSTQLVAATTDSTLKVIDLRTCNYAHEMKITNSSVGLVRCLSMSSDSRLVAVAHSSGVIATLDLRTGQLLATWKPHEGEVLALQWYEKGTFISSALDQTLSVWSVFDKKLKFSLKGSTEPVHLLRLFGKEVLTGTTANRIGIHSAVSPNASFSSIRLRSETFRGVLTAMEILPLNRQLLMGADSGTLQLLC